MDFYAPCLESRPEYDDLPYAGEAWEIASRTITDRRILKWTSMPLDRRSVSATSSGAEVVLEPVRSPILAGLGRIRQFANLRDNWDAEGASAPRNDELDTAARVFGLIAEIKVPEVTLSCEGNPMLVFDGTMRGEIVITGSDRIDYFFVGDGSPAEEDVDVSGESLPHDLTAFLASEADVV